MFLKKYILIALQTCLWAPIAKTNGHESFFRAKHTGTYTKNIMSDNVKITGTTLLLIFILSNYLVGISFRQQHQLVQHSSYSCCQIQQHLRGRYSVWLWPQGVVRATPPEYLSTHRTLRPNMLDPYLVSIDMVHTHWTGPVDHLVHKVYNKFSE